MTEFGPLRVEPVIPTELHGFAVRVGLAPYPPDAVNTHRRAVYAELFPIQNTAVYRMRKIGRERILGWVPLTAEGVSVIQRDPSGPEAEQAATDAVREASRLAKQLMAA